VQRAVVALEQLEAGRETRLGAPEHREVVQVFDVGGALRARRAASAGAEAATA
jgi:hypothetical protein